MDSTAGAKSSRQRRSGQWAATISAPLSAACAARPGRRSSGAQNVPRSKPALARDSGGLPTDHWLARAGKRGTKNPAASSATAGWRPGYCSLHEIVADRFRRRHRGRGPGRASAKGLACSPVSTVRSAALVSVVLDAPAIAVNAIRAAKRSAMVVRDASMSEIDLPGMEGVTSAPLPLAPEAIPGGRVLPPRGEERVPGKVLLPVGRLEEQFLTSAAAPMRDADGNVIGVMTAGGPRAGPQGRVPGAPGQAHRSGAAADDPRALSAYVRAARRARTAAASSRSTGTVASQPRHASVTDWP